jgi:AbrB family looped-hinge helix DNA binding protein
MTTKVTADGRIVLPAQLRAQDDLRAGQQFEITRLRQGQYLLKKIESPVIPGLVAWLQSCPTQGWFQPIRSESTAKISSQARRGST